MHAKGSFELSKNRLEFPNQLWTAMANYRVIRQDDSSFAVEVTRSGALSQMAAGFVTEAEAEAWIAQDRRLWESADPFRTSVGRGRRPF